MFFKKRKFIKKSRLYKEIFFNELSIIYDNGFLIFKKNNILFNLVLYKNIKVLIKDNSLLLFYTFYNKLNTSLLGTYTSIINSIILGYNEKFLKKILLVGVGYKAVIIYDFLYLYLGFSHPILYKIPKNVSIISVSLNEIHIIGLDKQLVFQVASIIRNFKKPDIYKGKGVRYLDEVLKFKEIKKK
ncbi:50S ribosomal protein L6p (L9e) [Candidatus Nasuia deltocephalinicola]|nr:50S ribosomal protein L6p (L9e) [Candidatus Nasuia deltocephalinicola]